VHFRAELTSERFRLIEVFGDKPHPERQAVPKQAAGRATSALPDGQGPLALLDCGPRAAIFGSRFRCAQVEICAAESSMLAGSRSPRKNILLANFVKSALARAYPASLFGGAFRDRHDT